MHSLGRTIIPLCIVAMVFSLLGCSVLYREIRYGYDHADGGQWTPLDSADEFGYFKVGYTCEGVTLIAPGQLHRDIYPEKLGPPAVPLFSAKHVADERNRLLYTRMSIASPHDSCVMNIAEIAYRWARDSIVHPMNYTSAMYVVIDTTRTILLEFRGPLFISDTVSIEFGTVKVGSREIAWPRLTYRKVSDTRYVPVTVPVN